MGPIRYTRACEEQLSLMHRISSSSSSCAYRLPCRAFALLHLFSLRLHTTMPCLCLVASLLRLHTTAMPLPLVADQVVEEFHRIFEEGMDCFVAGDWGASKSYFEQALAIVPRDKPSQVGVP